MSADVVCLGEALWDLHVPEGARLETTAHLDLAPGGGAVNVAKHLVTLGKRASVVAAVGADPVGRALVSRLSAMGIDVSGIHEAKPRTGLVVMTRSPPRAVAYRSPKEEALALRDALPERFDAAIVHVSGLLPSRALASALVSAMKRARRQGCIVSIDTNLRPKLWAGDTATRVGLSRVLAEADLLKVSDDDLRVLGTTVARDLRPSLRPDAVVVSTHGASATRAIGPFGELSIEGDALEVESAIGAGDAFIAGVLSVLAGVGRAHAHEREAIELAIRRGNEIARAFLGRAA